MVESIGLKRGNIIEFTEIGPKNAVNLGDSIPYFDVKGEKGYKYGFMIKLVPDIGKVKIAVMKKANDKILNTNTYYLNSGIYHYKMENIYLVFELIRPSRSYIYNVKVDSEYN